MMTTSGSGRRIPRKRLQPSIPEPWTLVRDHSKTVREPKASSNRFRDSDLTPVEREILSFRTLALNVS